MAKLRRNAAVAIVLMGALTSAPLFAQSAGVSVATLGHDKGEVRAPVHVIEFGDFGCGYCAQFARDSWPVIDSLYVRTGRVRWKYIPFVTGMFRNSREVSEAAECAAEQNAFWTMSDLLFERRREWMASRTPGELIGRYVKELKLDPAAFARCSMSTAARRRIVQNDATAQSLYLRGTPTFFINGRIIPGAIPLEEFRRILDAAGR
ncbi:MAG TPA: thioredoxin domain-containing protein [Gemmatimonadaceae bacterium]|nr:thioredoxin domain-containing protein [Gemmatimonadaceae bacterium]